MGLEIARTRPPRCFIVNVVSAETMVCRFNPTEFTEKIQVHWSRVAVPGLSHQLLQYQSTGNTQLPSLEFFVDAPPQSGGETKEILDFRNFLRALTVPPAGTEGVAATAPPRAIFIWPNVVTVVGVLTDLEFRYKQFGLDGRLLVYTATVTFEQIHDVRITSEERRKGS